MFVSLLNYGNDQLELNSVVCDDEYLKDLYKWDKGKMFKCLVCLVSNSECRFLML